MLSLYKLEIFATVADAGSFSAAGERLLMTQSAVSQHMQDLEASLGTVLFKRGRRGVTLTAAGGRLHEYTRQILRLVAEAEIAVTDVDHLREGQVRIGATPGMSVYLLPEWIQDFRARYNNLTATLQTAVTSEVIDHILKHRLDVGFIEGELAEGEYPRLAQQVLQDIHLYIIVSPGHEWHGLQAIPVAGLNGQPFITRQPGSKTRTWIDNGLKQYGIQPDIVAEMDNPESIKRLVMSGMGVAIMPEYAVSAEVEAGTLHTVALEGIPMQRTLKLVWDGDAVLSPVTRAFLSHLSARFPQLVFDPV